MHLFRIVTDVERLASGRGEPQLRPVRHAGVPGALMAGADWPRTDRLQRWAAMPAGTVRDAILTSPAWQPGRRRTPSVGFGGTVRPAAQADAPKRSLVTREYCTPPP